MNSKNNERAHQGDLNENLRNSEFLHLVIFELDKKFFAIEVGKIQEVIKYTSMTPTPGAESLIEGIIELRDGILPVVDLRKCLEMTPFENYFNTKIIVTEIKDYLFGFIVDRVDEVRRLPFSDFMAPPPGTIKRGSEFIVGVTKHMGNLLIYLNIDKVINIEQLMEVLNG